MPLFAILRAPQRIAIFRLVIMDVCMTPQLASSLLTQTGAWFLHLFHSLSQLYLLR